MPPDRRLLAPSADTGRGGMKIKVAPVTNEDDLRLLRRCADSLSFCVSHADGVVEQRPIRLDAFEMAVAKWETKQFRGKSPEPVPLPGRCNKTRRCTFCYFTTQEESAPV
jgi:hypothetical protein